MNNIFYEWEVRGLPRKEEIGVKCKEVENIKVEERKRERKECKLEMEREGDRGDKRILLFGLCLGIRKKKFKNDWGRRLCLFDKLVWTVTGYGVEIWGGEERKELEKLQERYLSWVLGVEWGVSGYIVREELQREKLRGRAGRRA
ncbi:hypothetical protein ACFW04_014604 [Cataglyphis niger]